LFGGRANFFRKFGTVKKKPGPNKTAGILEKDSRGVASSVLEGNGLLLGWGGRGGVWGDRRCTCLREKKETKRGKVTNRKKKIRGTEAR